MNGDFASCSILSDLMTNVGTNDIDTLFSILTIPRADYSAECVWKCLGLSHSSLRSSFEPSELIYYGMKLGSSIDMGVVVTVNGHVRGQGRGRGVVYVNR